TPTHTCTNQGINKGCSDAYGANLGCQYLDITGVPPGNYTLRVTLDPFGRIPELNEANNVATLAVTIPGGSRADTCAGATTIPPAGGTFTGTTSGTGSLAGSCGSSGPSPENIYVWTPPTSGTATIQTCGPGTNFDTVVYVRSGSCAGTEVTCNDDAPCTIAGGSGRGSRVTPTVTAGQAGPDIPRRLPGGARTHSPRAAPPAT